MPKISYIQATDVSAGGGVMTWDKDDWMQGLAPQWSQNGNKSFGLGAAYMLEADPYRNLGKLAPGYSPATAINTSAITSPLRNIVNFGGYGYAIESLATTGGGYKPFHRIDLSTGTISNTGSWPQVGGTSYRGEDCIYLNMALWGALANRDVILCTADSGTYGQLYAYNITDDIWDNNFTAKPVNGSSSGLTTGVPLKMILSPFDGLVYITNGQNVASYDPRTGTNGTINYTALSTIPYGFICTSFAQTQTHLVVYAYRTEGGHNYAGGTAYHGEAKAFFWDRHSSQWDYCYDLEDDYVDGGFNKGDIVGCFTYGRTKGSDGKQAAIRLFYGSNFEIPEGGIFSGNIPRHGGVDIIDDVITFYSDGKVYTYGSPWVGGHNPLFNGYGGVVDTGVPIVMMQRAAGSGTSIFGCLKNLTSSKVYISSGATTSGGLETLSANYSPNTIWQGLYAEPEFPQGMMGDIEKVQVKFANIASAGRALKLDLNSDRGQTTSTVFTAVTAVTVQGTDESSTSKKIISYAESDSSDANFPRFTSVRPTFTWSTGSGANDAPQISEISIYFRNIAQS